jgi:hypothetical protein
VTDGELAIGAVFVFVAVIMWAVVLWHEMHK